MRTDHRAITLALLTVLTLLQTVRAARPQETAADVCATNMRSVDCRKKVAGIIQANYSEAAPNMRIGVLGDVIVFADPKVFETQESRTSFHNLIQISGMEAQLCNVGFKKMRLESADAPREAIPGEEYDFRCPKPAEPPKAKTVGPAEAVSASPREPASKSPEQEAQSKAGVITGKIFLITRSGDLKPARLAMVFLLDEHAGGNGGKDSAAVLYLHTKIENMKTSFHQLADPDENISCPTSLLVFDKSLKSTLEWNEKEHKDQIEITETDEDGAFRFSGVRPGEYLILAKGHAGANQAYWEQDAIAAPGKEVAIKLASPAKACLDMP
jgi:hypothetical protein